MHIAPDREKVHPKAFCVKCESDGIIILTQHRLKEQGPPGYIGKLVSARCFCSNGKNLSPLFPRVAEVDTKYYKL